MLFATPESLASGGEPVCSSERKEQMLLRTNLENTKMARVQIRTLSNFGRTSCENHEKSTHQNDESIENKEGPREVGA